ncbi:MAG TPA: alpha/beta hydrolase [Acidimicrobiales bacterium]|nr:alpha/beta hydrolase [Acidimicrobiales bacterium]
MTTHTLSCNGAVLAYEDAGSGSPPLIVIHGGAFCDRTHMRPLIEHFSQHHRVVAPDLRGHGASEAVGPIANAQFADDIAVLCDQLVLEDPVLVGHSTGGHAALEFAGRHPGRAAAVVLLDIGPLSWSTELAERNHRLAAALRSDAGPQVLQAVAGAMLPADQPFAGREEAVAKSRSASPLVFADLIESDLAWDGKAAAARCPSSTPTLLVSSDSPLVEFAEFGDLCPHALMEQTVGGGHFLQLVVPDQVIAVIERFLARNAS